MIIPIHSGRLRGGEGRTPSQAPSGRQRTARRRLQVEALEGRLLLAVQIGVVAHGLQPDGEVPAWVGTMSAALADRGYATVIPFDWADQSQTPGAAASQGTRLATEILDVVARYGGTEPVDVHLISHSEGAVVASQALLDPRIASNSQIQDGELRLTLLDPHPAHNHPANPQYSAAPTLLGAVAEAATVAFQAAANDPEVIVPSYVDLSEVYYQHTPYSLAPATSLTNSAGGPTERDFNLWGETPPGVTRAVDLTGEGIGHDEVIAYYQDQIIPTLTVDARAGGASRVTGVLSPGSDRGTSGSDNITNVNQPTFAGTAPPGSTVRLFAQPAGQGPVLVGATTAGVGGDWTLTVGPLADGTYTISATTTDQAGQTGLPTPLLSSESRGPLVIDTVAPRITGVPIAPRIGGISVYYRDDRSGMDQASLTDAAHYALIPLQARRARFLTRVEMPSPEAGPTDLQAVAVTINNGRRLPRGQAQLTIISGGVADRAGNALDGEYSGSFPSGNGQPGGDFVARYSTDGRRASTLRPISSRFGPRPRRNARVIASTPPRLA